MEPVLDEYQGDQEQSEREQGQTTDTDGDVHTDTDRATGTETEDGEEDTVTTPSQSRSSSMRLVQQQNQVVSNINVVVQAVGGEKKQEESTVDVFDGYSFKGRHSVLIDSSDEEEEEEEEEEEDQNEEGDSGSERTGMTNVTANVTTSTIVTTTTESSEAGDDLSSVLGSIASPSDTATPTSIDEQVVEQIVKIEEKEEAEEEEAEEEEAEPKTPEARPVDLPVRPPLVPAAPFIAPPAVPMSVTVDTAAEPVGEKTKEVEDIEKLMATAKALENRLEEGGLNTPTEDKSKGGLPPAQPPLPLQQQKSITTSATSTTKQKVQRRERSGVPALDKDLPEDTEAGEDTEAVGRYDDDEDDDWDFIDAVDGEDRNGAKGTSLFARGVVDRYRLAVFSRKASTPSKILAASAGVDGVRPPSQRQSRHQGQQQQRTTLSKMSPKSNLNANGNSEKRGRSALAFTRGPRQFLQPKNANTSPPVSLGSGKGSGNREVSTPTKSGKQSACSSSTDHQQLLKSPKKGKSFGPLSTTLLSSNNNSYLHSQSHSQTRPSSDLKRNSSSPTSMSPNTISSSSPATAMLTNAAAAGLLTPSLSIGSSAVMSLTPSLKSRESTASGVGGVESDQSFGPVGVVATANVGSGGEQGPKVYSAVVGDESSSGGVGGVNVSGGGGGEKTKGTNKLKKYKEGAEKVLSLFSGAGSPKQHHHAS